MSQVFFATDDEGVTCGIEGFSDGSCLLTLQLGADRLDMSLTPMDLAILRLELARHTSYTNRVRPAESAVGAEDARSVAALVAPLSPADRASRNLGKDQ